MRALAKLFEITCVLFAIVTVLFLFAAVEGNAPQPIHQRYVYTLLFAGTGLLASIAACLFCVSRIPAKLPDHRDPSPIPQRDPRRPPSLRVITKLLDLFSLLFLVAALLSITIVANSKAPRPPGDPYFLYFCLSLAACILCSIISHLINARWKKHQHPTANADDPSPPHDPPSS